MTCETVVKACQPPPRRWHLKPPTITSKKDLQIYTKTPSCCAPKRWLILAKGGRQSDLIGLIPSWIYVPAQAMWRNRTPDHSAWTLLPGAGATITQLTHSLTRSADRGNGLAQPLGPTGRIGRISGLAVTYVTTTLYIYVHHK